MADLLFPSAANLAVVYKRSGILAWRHGREDEALRLGPSPVGDKSGAESKASRPCRQAKVVPSRRAKGAVTAIAYSLTLTSHLCSGWLYAILQAFVLDGGTHLKGQTDFPRKGRAHTLGAPHSLCFWDVSGWSLKCHCRLT